MATIQSAPLFHPSNPYYNSIRPPDEQPTLSLLDQEWPAQQPPPPQRSMSDTTALSESSTSSHQAPRPPNVVKYRTRSIGGPFSAGVVFERQIDLSPPNDDEIIIATVRVTNSFRRASIEGCDELPSRPTRRNFFRRVSTRISGPVDRDRYVAIKMPRRDYKKYFARDKDGNYAGTEPEREWTEADLDRDFAMYQEMRLRSIPGESEYGEGVYRERSGSVPVYSEEYERVTRAGTGVCLGRFS